MLSFQLSSCRNFSKVTAWHSKVSSGCCVPKTKDELDDVHCSRAVAQIIHLVRKTEIYSSHATYLSSKVMAEDLDVDSSRTWTQRRGSLYKIWTPEAALLLTSHSTQQI